MISRPPDFPRSPLYTVLQHILKYDDIAPIAVIDLHVVQLRRTHDGTREQRPVNPRPSNSPVPGWRLTDWRLTPPKPAEQRDSRQVRAVKVRALQRTLGKITRAREIFPTVIVPARVRKNRHAVKKASREPKSNPGTSSRLYRLVASSRRRARTHRTSASRTRTSAESRPLARASSRARARARRRWISARRHCRRRSSSSRRRRAREAATRARRGRRLDATTMLDARVDEGSKGDHGRARRCDERRGGERLTHANPRMKRCVLKQ